MNRNRFTVPVNQIKKRCICRQCGQVRYDSEANRSITERGMHARNEGENHCEHVYPHPDTWEP